MKPRGPVPPLIGYAMAAVAAFGIALAFAFVLLDYPLEWGEGRVFDTARLITAGDPIYCDIRQLPCADLTYPPLYSLLVAALGKLFGLTFTTGRAVSFAALLWVLFSLHRIARISSDKLSALVAPAGFLLFVEACFYAGVMRPDFLSLALVLAAMDLVLRHTSKRSAALAALLVLTGLFTKPHALASVFAICIYLAATDRKRLVPFIAVGAAGGTLVLVLAQMLSGGRFLEHHIGYVVYPSHTLNQLLVVLFYGALPWVLFIGVALYHSLRALRQRPVGFVPIYFLVSIAWALATSTGAGAAPNYLLELYAATALASAGFLGELRAKPGDQAVRLDRMAAAVLSLQVVLCLVVNPWLGLERYRSNEKMWSSRATMVPPLRSAPEPILVEELGVAGYTGHRLFVNSFVVTRLSNMNQWDEAPFLAFLRRGGFSRVVLREAPADHPTSLQRERFTPRMLEAIATHYRVSWSDGNWFVYEPREGDER